MSKTTRQLAFVDLPMALRFDAEERALSSADYAYTGAPVDGLLAQRGGEVRFEGVGKTFTTPTGTLQALEGVAFDVAPGEIFGVIGRSGAGKSTLIRLSNGLERPSEGRVLVDGIDIAGLDASGLRKVRRKIGMIFQHFNLMASRTVEDNVALPLRLAGVSRRAALARAADLLDLVGLQGRAKAYPNRLSGGQKQRVGIARALVSNPDILLCDEATSALDPETTRSILALLKDINRRLGITIVLITHEMEVIREICDRVAVIEKGRIAEIGPVWRVFGDPQSEAARALLRHQNGSEARDTEAAATDALFEVEFTGAEPNAPDLFAISQALGPGSRLVDGGIERIQGRSQGRLKIAVAANPSFDADAALARLQSVAPKSRRL